MNSHPFIPNSTQIPDVFLDVWMSVLSGSEFKVLMYLARRTYGFRKESDKISVKQFTEGIVKKDGTVLDTGTGLSDRAVRSALDSLQSHGVVVETPQRKEDGSTGPSEFSIVFSANPSCKNCSTPPAKIAVPLLQKLQGQYTDTQNTENNTISVETGDSSIYEETIPSLEEQEPTDLEIPTLKASRLSPPPTIRKAVDSPTFNTDFIALWANYCAINPGTSRPLALKKAKALTVAEWDTLIENFPAWLELWRGRASIGEVQFIKHLHRFIEERMFTNRPTLVSGKKAGRPSERQTSEPVDEREYPVLAKYMGKEDRLEELGVFTPEQKLSYYKKSQSYSEEFKWGKPVPREIIQFFVTWDAQIAERVARLKRQKEQESE